MDKQPLNIVYFVKTNEPNTYLGLTHDGTMYKMILSMRQNRLLATPLTVEVVP